MQSFDKTRISEVQRREFEKMSEYGKELVRKGHLVTIVSLETGDEICCFNRETYKVPKDAIERLASTLLPDIIKYYNNEKDTDNLEE